jgi:hypothetical protein
MKKQGLMKKQRDFLRGFAANQDALSVLVEKYNVPIGEYQSWLENPQFVEEMNGWIALRQKENQVLLLKAARTAIDRLVCLMETDGETGRKACMDVFALMGYDAKSENTMPSSSAAIPRPAVKITDEMAERVLEMLADEGDVEKDDVYPGQTLADMLPP